MHEYILEMKGISKSFYGVRVLKDVQLNVKPGEVHVLLGENGAGKSTLIKILSAAYKKECGMIKFNGECVEFRSPKEAIDNGISVIYQEFNLNPCVPIYENIYLGKEYTKKGFIDTKAAIKESKKYMDLIGLDVSPTTLVSELSVAQKQMVEIAKAISSDVKVLVLDEPTAAITDKETTKLFEIIHALKSEGVGIIYISHRMSELFEIGDRCTVMRDGEYVSTVYLHETDCDALTKLMVGRKVSFEKIENHAIKHDEVVLEVKNLCYKDVIKNVNLSLKKGEILGIAGLVGAGRTELAKCIIGAYKTKIGSIILKGEALKGNSIKESIDKGMVYLSEDRKDEGLILMHTVLDNMALPNLKRFGGFLLSKDKMKQVTHAFIDKLKIKTYSPFIKVENLSGGNQQKVVIAKWLYSDSDIYIFDEPTRGIDVGARDEIYEIMRTLIEKGASIVMISSDLVEILKMCDSVAVMREGEITAVLPNDNNLTQEDILACALYGGNNHEC
ncbi:sugar ABC transporter ATP-binding protein [Vallitalea pronyensis]|uniref:Sugar ABC transporter ATP-binding protein n=1 Tax=Vallitalea pronyensis TaxID=1348613 RepID=A0A8J8MJT0_9FIRM|nr:sugar ABC transporter ATP-binding protein [Vallitalea pronyensis]QUI22568.1 sugar ABC transporter ATP-binding protein [Vallitalea pronyensis]